MNYYRESIPFQEYNDDFGIPYIAEFAKACQEYIVISGVKNCFVVKCPLYLDGEVKTLPLLFQNKGNDVYECTRGNATFLIEGVAELKKQVTDALRFAKMCDGESEQAVYGVELQLPFYDTKCYTFSIAPIVTGAYRITCFETNDEILIPNLHTKFAVQYFLDLLKMVYIRKEISN